MSRLFNVVAAGRAGMPLLSEPWSAAKQAASPLTLFGLSIGPGWVSTAIRDGTESSMAGALTWGIRDGVENWSGYQHHTWADIARDAAIGGTLNLIVGSVAGGLSGARMFGGLSHRGHVVLTKLVGRPLINGPTTAFTSRPQQHSWLVGGPSALPLSGVNAAPGLRTAVGGPAALVTAGGGAHRVRPGESLVGDRAAGLWRRTAVAGPPPRQPRRDRQPEPELRGPEPRGPLAAHRGAAPAADARAARRRVREVAIT